MNAQPDPPNDIERRAQSIRDLVTCYPRFTLSAATFKAYELHLDGLDASKVEAACNTLARTSTFFPSIAEILAIADPQPPKPKITGWRHVRGSHGSTYIEDPEGTDVLRGT